MWFPSTANVILVIPSPPFFHFRLSALKSIKSPEKMIPASNKGLELGVINQDVWVMSLKLNPLYNQSQCEKEERNPTHKARHNVGICQSVHFHTKIWFSRSLIRKQNDWSEWTGPRGGISKTSLRHAPTNTTTITEWGTTRAELWTTVLTAARWFGSGLPSLPPIHFHHFCVLSSTQK